MSDVPNDSDHHPEADASRLKDLLEHIYPQDGPSYLCISSGKRPPAEGVKGNKKALEDFVTNFFPIRYISTRP